MYSFLLPFEYWGENLASFGQKLFRLQMRMSSANNTTPVGVVFAGGHII